MAAALVAPEDSPSPRAPFSATTRGRLPAKTWAMAWASSLSRAGAPLAEAQTTSTWAASMPAAARARCMARTLPSGDVGQPVAGAGAEAMPQPASRQ